MMANAADNILGLVGGQAIRRDREAEFRTQGTSAEAASTQWKDLKARISSTLGNLSDEALAEKYEHRRRGRLTGFEIMVTVARHAAEHVGHAELTLDLLAAARGDLLYPAMFSVCPCVDNGITSQDIPTWAPRAPSWPCCLPLWPGLPRARA